MLLGASPHRAEEAAVETEGSVEGVLLAVANVTLPAAATLYWCKFFRLPAFDGSRRHLIRVRILQPFWKINFGGGV